MLDPIPVREFTVDALAVRVYATRAEMGRAAGESIGARLKALIAARGGASALFAAAPSQREFLATLAAQPSVDWAKVTAFHLDEYLGLPDDAPQRFGNWLRAHLFDQVRPGTVHFLDGNVADPAAECARYAALLRACPPDISCIGIGENGHIAFNDPWVADFADPEMVKVVPLDAQCRAQQVHDGCFSRLEEVPTHALTLTMPVCVAPPHVSCVVPASSKAEAVRATLRGPISEECPASILRRHPNAVLYLDADSAALV